MMSQTKQNLQGFSLIEVVVYIAIFLLVSIGSVTLLLTLQKQVYQYQANQILVRNATSVMERVLFDIRAADTISGGTFGSSPGDLSLLNGATTTAYSLSGGNLMVSVNGGQAAPLTGSPVTVSSLQFDQFDNGVSEAVRITFTMQSVVGGVTVSDDFSNTSVLLSSYD